MFFFSQIRVKKKKFPQLGLHSMMYHKCQNVPASLESLPINYQLNLQFYILKCLYQSYFQIQSLCPLILLYQETYLRDIRYPHGSTAAEIQQRRSQFLFIKYGQLFSNWLYELHHLTSDLVFLSLALSLCLLTKPAPHQQPPPKKVNIGKNVFFENQITKLNKSKTKKDLKDIYSLISTKFIF